MMDHVCGGTQLATEIPNAGRTTSHVPEVILKSFSTRVGHRVGRMLGSMFPHVRAAAMGECIPLSAASASAAC